MKRVGWVGVHDLIRHVILIRVDGLINCHESCDFNTYGWSYSLYVVTHENTSFRTG